MIGILWNSFKNAFKKDRAVSFPFWAPHLSPLGSLPPAGLPEPGAARGSAVFVADPSRAAAEAEAEISVEDLEPCFSSGSLFLRIFKSF